MYEDIFSEIEQSEKREVIRQNARNSANLSSNKKKKSKTAKPESRTNQTARPQNRNNQTPPQSNQKNKRPAPPVSRRNDEQSRKIIEEKERIKREREKIKKTADKKASKRTPSPKRRRAARIVFYAVIFASTLAVGVILSLTVLFKSEQITVDGNARYSTEDIAKASKIELGENIFLTDKKTPSKLIVDNFPYVESADVGFVIPNTISINIKEAQPSYAVRYNDVYYLISTKGRILEKTQSPPKNIPLLSGSELKSTAEGEYVKFNDALSLSILQDIMDCIEKNGFEKLSSVDVTNVARVKIVYDNRIVIKIGVPEDIDYKIRTAMKIIDEHLDPDKQGLIQGELDVSTCNTTKKSYFNEKAIEALVPTTTAPPTTEPTAEPTAQEETSPDEDDEDYTDYQDYEDGDGDPTDYNGGDYPDEDGEDYTEYQDYEDGEDYTEYQDYEDGDDYYSD